MQYQKYRLEVEYQFAGKAGNCGVLVHASTPRALYGMFQKSLEVHMQHQEAGEFWCIEEDITVPNMVERRGAESNWRVSAGKLRRIKILPMAVRSHWANGTLWLSMLQKFRESLGKWSFGERRQELHGDKGQIVLQAEGTEVEFKKLMIKPIKKLSR